VGTTMVGVEGVTLDGNRYQFFVTNDDTAPIAPDKLPNYLIKQ